MTLAFSLLAVPAVHAQPQQKKAPPPVIVIAAKKDHFTDSVEALGTLRANETVTLTATVTETVTAVNFEDGERVEKDAVLVEMTDGQEKAELEAERATVEEAKVQLERIGPLVKTGAAAESLLDQRQREYDTAIARLDAVQSRIGDRIIAAPFAGIVGLRNISVGAVVQPGMQITTIDDDSVMKLDFSVPELFLSALEVGLEIEASTRAFDGRTFKGKIASINSQIDPITRSLSVRALLDNEDRVLRPGLLMSVEIFKNPRDTIVIPEEALIPEARKNFVFVVTGTGEQAKAEKREIETGARRPGQVEVLKGLEEDELVVTHGGMNIGAGGPVNVTAQDKGGQKLKDMLQKETD